MVYSFTMRILFVDDEPLILKGFKRALFHSPWQVSCAASGAEALSVLDKGGIQVVVTDMRMPNMDGAELLSIVHQRYPFVVRIIISGFADPQASMRASLVAHQWLDKPCHHSDLEDVLARIDLGLSSVLNEKVREAIGRVRVLPSPPSTYMALHSLICTDRTDMTAIANIIAEDPGIAAKVLQLVHSSFFSRATSVCDVSEAVVRLGIDTVSHIVLLAESYSDVTNNSLFTIEEQQAQSLAVSRMALHIAPKAMKPEAGMAGLLHELGRSIFTFAPAAKLDDYIHRKKGLSGSDVVELEKEVFGVDYGEAGGYLLLLWGFPLTVIEAVIHHHNPHTLMTQPFGIGASIYVAKALVQHRALDPEFVEHFQIQNQVPHWQGLLEEIQ